MPQQLHGPFVQLPLNPTRSYRSPVEVLEICDFLLGYGQDGYVSLRYEYWQVDDPPRRHASFLLNKNEKNNNKVSGGGDYTVVGAFSTTVRPLDTHCLS